ncbi:MAG TPA: hypothetical protein VMS55_16655 [Myxococcota bacterium]|nr:hypothetical protein [Myxococcota bacterium]
MLGRVLKAALMGLAVACASAPAGQKDAIWKDVRGAPLPDTAFRKSVDGFGAWVLVTSDMDWQEKLYSSARRLYFTEADTVEKGGHLHVLIFFTNPGLTETGRAEIACDIEVERPDGSISIRRLDAACFGEGPLPGPAQKIYNSTPELDFVGEESDPVGEWRIRVKMKDRVRGVEIPLETSFTLE